MYLPIHQAIANSTAGTTGWTFTKPQSGEIFSLGVPYESIHC